MFFLLVVNGKLSVAFSQQRTIEIKLYYSSLISSVAFTHVAGEYSVYSDCRDTTLGRKLFDVDKNSSLQIFAVGDSVVLKKPSSEKESAAFFGKFKSLRFTPKISSSSFKIKPLTPDLKSRTYDDELDISVQFKSLRLINKVNIEKYVAGVVQAEVGIKNPQEFNKVKAIVCRTYALGNWRRHEDEGFQLCDETHCQVYKGKSYNNGIHEAALATSEYVLVDDSVRVITAAFHSNCGGQTMNSEDVWSKPVSYLRSVSDSFCLHKTNAIWEKKFPKDLWLDYLSSKYNFPIKDSAELKMVLNFKQPSRSVYLVNNNFLIPLKFVREDMKLKSTFFTIKEENGNIIFSGKGFGHGVGLCQEGAMRMAEKGYSYTKILNYYYSNIHLIRFSQLDFFKAE